MHNNSTADNAFPCWLKSNARKAKILTPRLLIIVGWHMATRQAVNCSCRQVEYSFARVIVPDYYIDGVHNAKDWRRLQMETTRESLLILGTKPNVFLNTRVCYLKVSVCKSPSLWIVGRIIR